MGHEEVTGRVARQPTQNRICTAEQQGLRQRVTDGSAHNHQEKREQCYWTWGPCCMASGVACEEFNHRPMLP